MISAITLDEDLLVCSSSERLYSSGQLQHHVDPKLQSLKEQKWAASPGVELEECLAAPRLPRSTMLNRFSNAAEETADTALCAQPQRQPSMDIELFKSSSSSCLNYRSSMTESDFRSSATLSDYRSSKHFGPASFFLKEEMLSCLGNMGFDEDEDQDDGDLSGSSDLLQGTVESVLGI